MGFSIVKTAGSIFPGVAFTGLLTCAALVVVPNSAQAISPAYSTTSSFGGSYGTSAGSSFGFFFDTDRDLKIDALGFASQEGWNTGTSPYTVSLWSYTNAGNAPGDYTLIDSRLFTPTNLGPSYYFQGGYFWQNITPVTLVDSTTGDTNGDIGFVIGVDGDFSDETLNPNPKGNVLFEGGTATFQPGVINNDSGYNENGFNFFPIPVFPDGQGADGYFNGNFSFAPVPGPLPLLGAAAGFAYARRMRKRIHSASN